MRLRRVVRIEYRPGEYWDIPTAGLEVESEQEVYSSIATLTGASYVVDLMGSDPAPKRPGAERLAFRLVEPTPEDANGAVDVIRERLYHGGRVRIWTDGDDVAARRLRWAWGRVQSMPRVSVETWEDRSATITVGFARLSDWYGEDELFPDPVDIVASPVDVTVNNPGTARIYNAVITITGDVDHPRVENTANGYIAGSARVGAGEWLRFDAGRPAVMRSTDAGGTWVLDWGYWYRPVGQVQLMVLEPGDNTLRVTGVSDGTLRVAAYPAWH